MFQLPFLKCKVY